MAKSKGKSKKKQDAVDGQVVSNKQKTVTETTEKPQPETTPPVVAVEKDDLKSTVEGDTSEKKVKEIFKMIPKGRPKSGKLWKTHRQNRHSELKRDKPLKTGWAKKMLERTEKRAMKAYELQLRNQRASELQMKRQRQDEHKKRRLENERKSEIVQPIKNTAKIRRMKKKQLRMIEKR